MSKKIIIIFIILISIIFISILIVFKLNQTNLKEKEQQISEKKYSDDNLNLLSYNMIKYANSLVFEDNWIIEHISLKKYEINLYGLIEREKLDKSVLDNMICNYENTKLIIYFNDNSVDFDTNLDCIINKDKDGNYYNEEKLKNKLLEYAKKQESNYKKDKIYQINLNDFENTFKLDISMFADNYDLDKTKVIINTKNDDFNYEVYLERK